MWLEYLNCRAFFCLTSLTFVSYYNICVPLTLQTHALAQLVDELSCRYWDLGSIPRSPTYCIIFVVTYSHAASIKLSTIRAHAQACHILMRINLKATKRGLSYTSVNGWTLKLESQQRPCVHGPEFLKTYLPLGPDTPWFALFFSSLFIILLIVFNCFL